MRQGVKGRYIRLPGPFHFDPGPGDRQGVLGMPAAAWKYANYTPRPSRTDGRAERQRRALRELHTSQLSRTDSVNFCSLGRIFFTRLPLSSPKTGVCSFRRALLGQH